MPLMARYHFHFASRGGEQVSDPEGVELDDLRAAHRHAVQLIRRTALFTSRGWNAREWSVQVVDLERRPIRMFDEDILDLYDRVNVGRS